MGLFDALKNVYATGVTTVANVITSGVEKITGKTYGRTSSEEFLSTKTGQVLSTAAAGTAIVGAVAAVGSAVSAAGGVRAAASKVLTSVIPTTTKGKIIAAVATPVIVGAVTREPEKTLSTAINAPKELSQFGGDVATFAASPSIDTARAVITESPIISSAVAVAAAGAVGSVVAPVVGGYLQRETIQEQTKTLEKAISTAQPIPESGIIKVPPQSEQLQKEQPLGDGGSAPLPETTIINAPKKRYKRRQKQKTPSVRQSVKININNRPVGLKIENKRYLNELIIA